MISVGGPFTRIEWEQINLNSSDQVKTYLLNHGWEPDEWNFKKDKDGRVVRGEDGEPIITSPKLTESSFASVEGHIPSLIARRNILIHRKRMLKNIRKTDGEETGWLNTLRSDGRIGAGAIPLGTNTGRMRHHTVVNVPSVDAVYGHEIRDLFTVPDGYVMVGVDAAGLEARMQGHYVWPFEGGKELAELLIDGDIHQANADLWGTSRKGAKSPYYCLMYGGQAPKLASTMGCTPQEGVGYYEAFWTQYTALAAFRDTITKVWQDRGGKRGGYLRGLDGRKLFARSPHALVNLMFQSAGSICVKLATVYFNNFIKGMDAHQVIHMHDEFQIECREDLAEEVKFYALKSFERAGKYLKLNVPLVGDVKIGRSWAETH